MFQQSNYEEIKLLIPPKGMNKFISPDSLPDGFSYHLENILPSPLGNGQVRCGTKKINNIANPEATILESFLFVDSDSSLQDVLYTQSYTADDSADDFNILSQDTFVFSTTSDEWYQKDTYVKIIYELNGVNYTFYPKIQSSIFDDPNILITLSESFFPPDFGDVNIISISYSVGRIFVYDYQLNTFTDVSLYNMSVACIPRGTIFNKVLLICNGVDRILSWDGDTLSEVYDFVKENDAQNIVSSLILPSTFSFTSLPGFDQTKYPPGNLIKLSVNGVTTTPLTILNVVAVGALITITTAEAIPAFGAGDMVELFYRDWPPPFNYLYSGTDRIWALGPGASGINWREPDQALKVYYTYMANTTTAWFNENTKTVPFVDLSKKHGIQDNLEAIAQVNGQFAFIGRSKTQVWAGSIPGDGRELGNLGDFRWQMNIDIGTVHGNLVIEMPNDLYFISQTGLKSAGTLNIAKQFAATSITAVDPIIVEFLSTIMNSNEDYRACRSFKYKQGSFGGFKIGNNSALISPFDTNFYAWTFFSGDFQNSNTFVDTGSSLDLFIGNSIYRYADGKDGSAPVYGDKDGQSLVLFSWVPGLINRGTRGFACKRYQLIVGYPSSFPLNLENQIQISVSGDKPVYFQKEDICEFENKGDRFGEAPLAADTYASGFFKLGIDYSFLTKRFKFVSSSFFVAISGYTVNGPIYFRELKLFGVKERNG